LRGGYAQYVYLDPKTAVFKIPDDVPSERFLALGCGLPTMIHGIERIGGVHVGETVVVQGSGPVGIAAALISRRSGASRIIVIGGPEARLQLVRDLGAADDTIDIFKMTDPDRRVEEVKKIVKFGGDVAIEATGVPSAVQEGINMTRDCGRYLVIGQYSDRGAIPINPHYITRKQIILSGSWGFSGRHTYEALRFARDTGYPLEKLISHTFPLEKATEALEMMEQVTMTKGVILPWKA
jgi:threonine dehydrogenase-like Zn-dependent dehydrogenase